MGGLNPTTIETDFGTLNIMVNRFVLASTKSSCARSSSASRSTRRSPAGHFFAELLAKTGARRTTSARPARSASPTATSSTATSPASRSDLSSSRRRAGERPPGPSSSPATTRPEGAPHDHLISQASSPTTAPSRPGCGSDDPDAHIIPTGPGVGPVTLADGLVVDVSEGLSSRPSAGRRRRDPRRHRLAKHVEQGTRDFVADPELDPARFGASSPRTASPPSNGRPPRRRSPRSRRRSRPTRSWRPGRS